jgi:bla regulator protein blaR1
MSWQGAILILIAVLLYVLLDNKLHPKWRSLILLAIMSRLLLPAYPETSFSLFNIYELHPPHWINLASRLSDSMPVVSEGASTASARFSSPNRPPLKPAAGLISTGAADVAPEFPLNEAGTASGFSMIEALALVWLSIAIVLLSFLFLSQLVLIRRIKRTPVLSNPRLRDLADNCRGELGIRQNVEVVETDCVFGPALMGVFKPRILLPTAISAAFSQQDLRFIFLHELSHYRRRDLARIWLAVVLNAIHWFNPLVWLAARRVRAEADLCCDVAVLSCLTPVEKVAYGRTMLKALRFTNPAQTLGVAAHWFTGQGYLRERIRRVAEFENHQKRGTALTVVLLALLISVGFTDARRGEGNAAPARPAVYKTEEPQAAGTLIYGRLVDEERRPVPGAVINLRVDEQKSGRYTVSDAEGRFVWDAGSESRANLDVTAPGFLHPRFLTLLAGDREHEIHLYREGSPWVEQR